MPQIGWKHTKRTEIAENMKFIIGKIALSCGLAALVYSCSDGEKKGDLNDKQNVNAAAPRDTLKVERVKKVFYTLPSPLEITMLFKKEGVEYHRDMLNAVQKRKEYSTSISKAFNLGVYGADLSYSGLFGKHEAAIQYFAVSTILADDLGLGTTFQEDFIVRLEQHSGNKDTLLKVIEDFFVQNDQQLEQSEGQDLSSCVLIGGWIEGMYLGTKILNENTDA